MQASEWVALCALVVAVAAVAAAVYACTLARRLSAERRIVAKDGERQDSYAIIINPSKPGTVGLRQQVLEYFQRHGLPEPVFYETTPDDPGKGQAAQAIADGANIIVAAGGDGTVRAVAAIVAGKDITMGLIPMGTGNLLARNIDIDVNNLPAVLATLTSQATREIDLGYLQITKAPPGEPGTSEPEAFLVIGGIGFDAAMVADTSPVLKKRVGWIAYFLGGMRHLHAGRTRVRISLDDSPQRTITLRTLLIGNCGRLPGGLSLLPDAVIDDGRLDIAAVDTRAGIAGWVQLFGEVVLQGLGVRNDSAKKIGRIDHTTAKRLHVEVVEGAQPVQVDGDTLGRASTLEAWVVRRALTIRAPLAS
ncbi:diacylglycerol kinase family protein [Rarobacter faecitabidus]|uniref:Diacylglycerol kinase family enzyme n=1 Tax=Rarobacter faecitabidus TaxID=13243 RepID=A0A542ZB14_RARFA|nr:diacylglycerol kinase family protein [Rarobacter faecitabidus]TQL57502.1 diacylglycerol kinase family enzyme [Rarobacter faecitabidus]